jgi:2-oxoglutarate dehydrogenase E2 component (dihydrolipoamide succinyltransferase)
MISIRVPPLGESIVEATVGRWLKNAGDQVAQGEPLVELETDKINVEVPAPEAGVLSKVVAKEGATVKVDEVIAELDESGTRDSAATTRRAPDAEAPTPAPAAAAASEGGGAKKAAPAAKRVAAEESVDLGKVAGTGRGGRVTKGDVLEFVASRQPGTHAESRAPKGGASAATRPSPAPVPRAESSDQRETREPMSTRRKRIAQHLLEAQHETASLTTFNEVDMSQVMAVRERLKERVEKEHGVRLTFMPFFIRAASMALEQFPTINAQVDGETIIFKHYVNMGIAVASDAGLVVPVIRDADRKGMIEVSRELTEVAKRARDGKLTMDDLTGGSFTITNGGVFGSLMSTPILNFPQSGILGLHKIQERPVAVDGRVEVRPMMYLALSYDHRIVEGAHAVQFLVRVKELMEDPASMLVD